MSWNATWAGPYDETLKELHQKGGTSSEIAAAINRKHKTSFSRNAVIGRINRLGLKGKIERPKKEQKARRPRTDRADAMNTVLKVKRSSLSSKGNYSKDGSEAVGILLKIRQKLKGPKIKRESFKPRSVAVQSRHVSIIELKAMECRWPDDGGDPSKGIPHTFCGNRTADGSSYCPCHALLARGDGTPSERNALKTAKSIARAA